jgi:hypothetical protein
MKLSPILVAAALAFGGTAMAQSQDTHKRSDNDKAASARKANEPSMAEKAKEGAQHMGEATKRGAKRAAAATGSAAHRAADATRSAGQSIERKLPPAPGHARSQQGSSGETGTPGATRAMGAGSTGVAQADMSGDPARRQRMDDAYANWQRQHPSR